MNSDYLRSMISIRGKTQHIEKSIFSGRINIPILMKFLT